MPPSRPLNRRRIADAALALIDEEGFDALTVRSLGARLGVQSPSLYNHVSGKDEILAAVTALLGERIDLTTLDEPDLATALTGLARSYRAAFRGHPEVTALLARRPVTSPRAMDLYERLLTRLDDAGLAPHQAIEVVGSLETVVLGSVVLTFTAGLQGVDPDRAPRTSAALRGADVEEADEAAFERALSGLVEGLPAGRPA